ncbi:MAG TPA: peptide-N-glycosidase F-related protein, partial [Acidobacteriota bacterium]|nr:peptide-N-glycosidase F-related protein [Acidobacteriota bacterium]
APLLRGRRTFRAFVDTWSSPAWRLDLSLRYAPDDSFPSPAWAVPVYYAEGFDRERNGGGDSVRVTVPPGLARVVLKYVSTGHCTDGRDEDEFVSKANVISVDGVVVARVHPWRDDCRRFRDLNPYCARWTDGTWSSDYSRSGWCPSQIVAPMEFDLTDHLGPGKHTIRFAVEGMRPKDAEGHYGYLRLSAALVGWDEPPRLWRNE